MNIIDVVQGSEEWFAYRAGKLSASRFGDLMAQTKSGPGAAHFNLIADLAFERISGQKTNGYCSPAMMRGIELEPVAREAYEADKLVAVQEVGIVQHGSLDFVTCSPDGLITGGNPGLVEIKCMEAKNHMGAWLKGDHLDRYKWQLQGQLWICEADWVDMVAFNPDVPERFQLHIERVYRDEEAIKELERVTIEANEKIEQAVADLERAADEYHGRLAA